MASRAPPSVPSMFDLSGFALDDDARESDGELCSILYVYVRAKELHRTSATREV